MSAPTTTDQSSATTTARPHRARRWILTTLGALGALAAVVGVVALTRPPAAPDPTSTRLELETVTVTRGDLTEQVRTQGTLAHNAQRDLGTELTGVITGLPAPGTVVTVGQELFRIDDLPVSLLRGPLPAWRTFTAGMSPGNDVRQLEQNLAQLGFLVAKPDSTFSESTTAAIKKWQKSLKVEQNGTIDLGRVVFSLVDVRVQSHKAQVGDTAGPEILSVTGPDKQVQAFLDQAQAPVAPVGTNVAITLPGGVSTTGTVAEVGAPVEQEGGDGKTLKVPVTLTLDDPAAAESLDNVAVTLLLTRTRATDVLTVPVLALLAQPGGGFAVETSAGDSTQLVPVELGTFANGLVEVTGGDLEVGDTIVVAK